MEPDGVTKEAVPLWRRLGWMAAIWTASVLILGAVSLLLRAWLAA